MTRKHFDHRNYYLVLGAQPSADATEIRRKYRQAALRLHPDKGGSSQTFHLLTFAFEVLSCPFARAVYDKSCLQAVPGASNSEATPATDCSTNASVSPAWQVKPTTAMYAQPPRLATKRLAPQSKTTEAPIKRQRTCRTNPPCNKKSAHLRDCMVRLGPLFKQLRDVLQCMHADQRRASLEHLDPRVQAALVTFMETAPINVKAGLEEEAGSAPAVPDPMFQRSVSRVTGIASDGSSTGPTTYKVHAHIKALRFYTHGHPDLEVVLERQMVLVQLQQALVAASTKDPRFWDNALSAYQTCMSVLNANRTSEKDIGLSAFVYMRAGHWLEQSCTLISPVMPLVDVLELHRRLLRARSTSWNQLRSEWVQLLMSPWQPKTKRKSMCEAEALVDAARATALSNKFQKVAGSALKFLAVEQKRISRRGLVLANRSALALARAKKEVDMANRRSAKAKLDARKERLKSWWKRADLTMEDIMRGR